LSGGVYEVTVLDVNLDVATAIAEVLEPVELVLDPIITEPSVFGASDGVIDPNASGGTPLYTYIWSPNVCSCPIPEGLQSGDYEVIVTDINGCSVDETITLSDPMCDMPTNMTISSVTGASALAEWDSVPDALGYTIRIKLNSGVQWSYYNVNATQYEISGLAADSLYDVEVATVCDTSESAWAVESFTTSTLADYVLTECKGKVMDSGGDEGLYDNNQDYLVSIAPVGASRIRLTFESFATEATFDFLHIFDGDTSSANLIGTFDGETAGDNPGVITSSGGVISMHFTSDNTQIRDGWEAYWIADVGSKIDHI